MSALSSHRLKALARYAVEGVPGPDIAQALGASPAGVAHYLRVLRDDREGRTSEGEPSPKDGEFLRYVREYEDRVATAAALHRWRLTDMLDDAYTAVRTALQDGSPQVKSTTAWGVFDRLFGAPAGTGGSTGGPSVQVNLQLNQEVVRAMDNLKGVQSQLAALGTTTYTTHLREVGPTAGQPALPTAGTATAGSPS